MIFMNTIWIMADDFAVEDPFLVVVRDSIIYGIPLNPNDKSNDAMVPVAGLLNGYDVDFDDAEQMIYWVEQSGKSYKHFLCYLKWSQMSCIINLN